MGNKFFKRELRAQSSIETIIILATALFILTALVAIVYDQISIYNSQQDQKIASIAVNTVAKEVNDAYFLGPGTIKTILVRMPTSIDFSKSSIEGRSLVLNVGGTDIFASTKVDVRGIWPDESGTYSFTISAFDDYVSVSIRPVDVVPNQINKFLLQGESNDFNLIIANNSDEDYFYTMLIDFPNPSFSGATLTSTQVGLIESIYGETQTVNFSISCSLNSFGSYSGKITFVPTNSSDSNITVPVNLFCSSSQTKLQVYPTSKYFYATTNSTYNDSVLVCNTTSTDFSSTSASVSGTIAPFVVTSFTSPISANSCTTLPFVVNAPSSISNYLGTLLVNSGGYTSGVDLNLVLYFSDNVLSFDWSNAYFGADGKSINDINLSVLTGPFNITHAMILFQNDIEDANITGLYFNNQNTFPLNTKAISSQLVDIDDYILRRREIYDLNITFDSDIRNDSEKFRIILKTDANVYYWSQIFDLGIISDNNASHFSNLINGQEPIYPRDANLIALWRMNDKNSSGWILNSVSGLRDGNLKSGADVNGIGLWDKNALYLDGVGTYVALNSFSLDSNNFTISAWVNPDSGSLSARRTVFQSAVGEQPQLEMGSCSGGINAVCAIKDGIWMAQSVNNVINTGSWYHVVYTKNGSGANHNFYVNGALVDLVTNNPVNYNSSASSVKNIGARSSIQFFDGLIDEVAIWNAALSAEEVKEIYSIGSGVHNYNTQADGNGLYLASTNGQFVSDGNFYSRVFDFNGMVDFNQLFFTKNIFGFSSLENTFLKDENLNNNYSQSSLVSKRIDTNNFIASGELDWNLSARNDYGSGNEFSKTGGEFFRRGILNDANLVALWHLNNNALDYSGNSINGSWSGVESYGEGVAQSSAASLNGSSVINFGQNSLFNISGGLTLAAWIYPSGNNDNGGIIVKDGQYKLVWSSFYRKIYCAFDNSVWQWCDNLSTSTLAENTWSFVAVTYNPSVGYTYYINGLPSGGGSDINGALSPAENTQMQIGVQQTTMLFDGKIDEASVWNRNLSAEEIYELYTYQKNDFYSSFIDNNLVGLWHLDNDLNDFSLNNKIGSWVGSGAYDSGLWDSNAGLFNGDGNIITTALSVNFDNPHTYSAWINPEVNTLEQRVVSLGGSEGILLAGTSTGSCSLKYIGAFVQTGAASWVTFCSTTLVSSIVGQWSQVSLVVEPNSQKLFLNGILIAQNNSTMYSSNSTFRIGGQASYYYKGKVDEVAVWDRALLNQEMLDLYNSQRVNLQGGLVGLWRMNDKNSSGYILNSITRLRDGNLFNGADVNALGIADTNAGYFDGVNDYVTGMGDINNLDTLDKNFSFSAWVKIPAGSGAGTILSKSKYGSQTGRWALQTSSVGKIHLFLSADAAADFDAVVGNTDLRDNIWHHVVLVLVRDGNAFAYVDGVFDGTASISTQFRSVSNYNNPCHVLIGAYGDETCLGTAKAAFRPFRGNIDELSVWNRELSAEEINLLYLSQAGNFSEPNLVGVYHFNNNANDLSGNRNDGVWTGTQSYSSGLFGTSAASFNGSSYVLANDATTLNKFTLSAWLYKPTLGVQGVAMLYNTTTTRYARIFNNSASATNFEFDAKSEVGNLSTGANSFALNDWVHVAASFDGTIGRLYLNGSLKSFGTYDMNAFQANNIYFGSIAGSLMTGKMDEVIIWDKALSDEQIRNLYTSQKGSWLDSNLVFYQNFDSYLGTIVHDNARGFNGTLSNGALITKGLWDSNSVYLDGLNDSVYFASVKGDLNRKITISLWVYPTKIDDYKTVIQDTNGASVTWALQNKYQSTNGYTWYWSMYTQKGLGYAGLSCEIKHNRSLGEWQQVALTYDADTNVAKVYHNGIYCPGNAGVFGGELTISNSYLRGLTLSSASSGFRGYVDEIKIYDRVLSDAEMLADYNRFLNSNFVDANVVDANNTSVWDSVKINSNVGYDFGKEIEDWNKLKEKGINEFGKSNDANYLFRDNNLSGLWHFNNNLIDSSGNNNNGSWWGPGVLYSLGNLDTNAVDFSRLVGRYAYMPDSSTLDRGSELTVSAWVNLSVLPSTKGVESAILAKNNEYLFRINTDNKPRLYIWDGTDWEASVGSSVAIPIKTWVHIVASMRFSGSNIIKKIYVNGILTGTESTQTGTLSSTINELFIGSWATGSIFDGQIDEVAIWKKELSSQNVLDLYNSQKPMFQNGLIGLWHLNDNALDSSPYLKNGVWSGSESYSQGLFDTNAGEFNGSSYIDISNATNLNPTNALSASFWIKPSININEMDGWAGIFSKGTFGGTYQWGCMKYDTTTVDENRLICMFYFADNSSSNIVTNTLFFANKWYHVVFVLDAVNGVKSIYVNGVLDNNASASKLAIKTTADPLSIGRVRTTEKFKGKIEEFALYERALSSNEVIDLYRKGVSRLDLNIYSCSDETCLTKTGSQYISDANNGVWMDLNSNIAPSKYLGFDAFFKSPSNYSDKNAGNFWVGSFIRDVNFYFPSNTSLDLYVRTSVTGYSWDDWNVLNSSSPQTLSIRDANYFQYKSILNAISPSVSPVLHDINVNYTRISN